MNGSEKKQRNIEFNPKFMKKSQKLNRNNGHFETNECDVVRVLMKRNHICLAKCAIM